MKTVIMAGGRGTRIAQMFPDLPKPMIPIEGKPVLEHQIEQLRSQGFLDILLTVSYQKEQIMDYFGDGNRFGVAISYFEEDVPMGNVGALFRIADQLSEDILLINGDILFDVDLERFYRYHKEKGGVATLFTHPNNHPYDSGLIEADAKGNVTGWYTKEGKRPKYYQNRVNAGIHLLRREAFKQEGFAGQAKIDLDRDVLRPLVGSGTMFCYDSPEYVKDMGTPQRWEAVSEDTRQGRLSAKRLSNPQRAIFLDRDGTINREVGIINDIERFELLPGVCDAIRRINRSGYLAIVITNQSVIARGDLSYEGLEEIHHKMETLLGEEGAYLDGLYYCPHHPHSGYEGERKELKIDCECRKPKPGMLYAAAERFHIALENSWMIGDGERDIIAGKAAGCKTVLLGRQNFGQDISADTLLGAVREILRIDGG